MAQAPTLEPYRFTRDQYEQMVEAGVLADRRAELVEGLVVDVSPQGPDHARLLLALMQVLAPAVAERRLRVQMPLAATADSEPEPDLLLVASAPTAGHPQTGLLAIEVAVSQQAAARAKAAIYAAADVTVFWLVDVPARTVELLDHPKAGRYGRQRVLRGDDVLEVVEFGARLTVAELFARAGLD